MNKLREFVAAKQTHLVVTAIIAAMLTVGDALRAYYVTGGHSLDPKDLPVVVVGVLFVVGYTVASHLDVLKGGPLDTPAARATISSVATDLLEGQRTEAQAMILAEVRRQVAVIGLPTPLTVPPEVTRGDSGAMPVSAVALPAGTPPPAPASSLETPTASGG